jgi:hypothetical protein
MAGVARPGAAALGRLADMGEGLEDWADEEEEDWATDEVWP